MPENSPGKDPPQLLLIDDDRKLSRLLTQYLESQGFDMNAAYDGAEGLDLMLGR